MISTNCNFVIDSFAWIEYFKGNKKAARLKDIIETGKAITPAIVLAELSDVYHRENNADWEKHLAFIKSKTAIADLTAGIAIEAGKIKKDIRKKNKPNFGLADAILLATALSLEAAVLTGDKHFKGVKNVEFIGD